MTARSAPAIVPDDRQERSGDSAKTFHRLAQEKELKGHQVECERRNGPELLEKSR